MERVAYVLLLLLASLWLGAVITGMITTIPAGIFGLLTILAFGILFIKVLKERLNNKEDDHYDKNVDL